METIARGNIVDTFTKTAWALACHIHSDREGRRPPFWLFSLKTGSSGLLTFLLTISTFWLGSNYQQCPLSNSDSSHETDWKCVQNPQCLALGARKLEKCARKTSINNCFLLLKWKDLGNGRCATLTFSALQVLIISLAFRYMKVDCSSNFCFSVSQVLCKKMGSDRELYL